MAGILSTIGWLFRMGGIRLDVWRKDDSSTYELYHYEFIIYNGHLSAIPARFHENLAVPSDLTHVPYFYFFTSLQEWVVSRT